MAEILPLRGSAGRAPHALVDEVFNDMTTSWQVEMTARHLGHSYIANRASVVSRFRDYAESDPWEWRPELMSHWSSELVTDGLSGSTIRSYQGAVRQFCEHITNPAYEWATLCQERFGTYPVQICFEWNTTAHVEELECDPRRRPLSREEIALFLGHLHERTSHAAAKGSKGTITAKRDYVFFAVIYAFGLRIDEACHLGIDDFSALVGFEQCGGSRNSTCATRRPRRAGRSADGWCSTGAPSSSPLCLAGTWKTSAPRFPALRHRRGAG